MDMVDESTPRPPWLTDEDLAAYTTLYEHSGFESALQVPYRRKHKELGISNPKVEVPVLLIIGGKDYFLKFPGIEDYLKIEKMREFMTDLEVVDLAEGTHFMQEQYPAQLNHLLFNFLTKHNI
ncbi:unnamed protein product [Citrullus colocynthis]|uniref:Epoxide hydrolase n=1 Tax=Citrullus colocynthis TaxID=252529 RepID=A0ABP0Z3U6_9ROSI